MLLGTLSAPKRGQVGSSLLPPRKTTTPESIFWGENVAPGANYGSKNRLKMILGTLSASNRCQVGSGVLSLNLRCSILTTILSKLVAPRVAYGSNLRPQMAFDVRLALGPSKNEFLGMVLENIRNSMNFRCENA